MPDRLLIRPSLEDVRAFTGDDDEWPWRHTVVFCDECGWEQDGDVRAERGEGASVLRAILANHGWAYIDGVDFCPDCAPKASKGMSAFAEQCDYVHEDVRCIFGADHTADYHKCGDKRVYRDGRVTGLGYTVTEFDWLTPREDGAS